MAQLSPQTGTLQEFDLPAKGSIGPYIFLSPGPDGNLWFFEGDLYLAGVGSTSPTMLYGGGVAQFNVSSHSLKEFPIPGGWWTQGDGDQVLFGADGALWFFQYDNRNNVNVKVPVRMDPTTGVMEEFPNSSIGEWFVPTAVRPDGNLWGVDPMGIGRFDTATREFNQFSFSGQYWSPLIVSGQEGNLWFLSIPDSNRTEQDLGQIDPMTGSIQFVPLPYARFIGPTISGIASADNAIWLSVPLPHWNSVSQTFDWSDRIVKFDPTTDTIQEFSTTPSPPPSSTPAPGSPSSSGSQTPVREPVGIDFVAVVASFTTATPVSPSTFSAVIDWGDGKTSTGYLLLDVNGAYGVYGNHTYLSVGSFKITVTVSETQPVDGTPGNPFTVINTAEIFDPLAVCPMGNC